MTGAKLKVTAGIGAAILLAGGTVTWMLWRDLTGEKLSPREIIKRAREKYASLTSYSDEGTTVAVLNGTTITTAFTIRLARPNLYRIEWEQSVHSGYANKGAVWSAGQGDFLQIGSGAKEQANQAVALASATGISGGAAATVPGTFFRLHWGDQLVSSALSDKQQPDEKVGDVDCYVFTGDAKGWTRTLWIGKSDFLIHQLRTVTSPEAMKTALAETVKRNPALSNRLQISKLEGSTSTETHTNIVLNPPLSDQDFLP